MNLLNKNTAARCAAIAVISLGLVFGGLRCKQRVEPADNAGERERGAPSAEKARIEDAELIERLYRLVQKRDGEIDGLLRRLENLETEVRSLRKGAESEKTVAADPSSGQLESAPTSTAPPVSPSASALLYSPPRLGVDETAAQAALDRFLIKKSGLLLAPWTSELEPSLSYVHASSDKVSIEGAILEPVFVIGDIISHKVRRDIVISALTYRLGLPHDFQADLYVPYRYERETTVKGDNTESSREGAGMGDVELGLTRQLAREEGLVPDLLGHVRWKARNGSSPYGAKTSDPPMGTGFHSIQFMATSVKVLDPVAFFGSLSYSLNLSDDKPQGRIDPGNTWGANLGFALALNLETTLNLGWEQRFTGRSTLNGEKVPGSALRVGTLRVGITHALTQNVALDTSVGIGLTQDTPDMQAMVAVPIRLPGMFAGAVKPAAIKPPSR